MKRIFQIVAAELMLALQAALLISSVAVLLSPHAGGDRLWLVFKLLFFIEALISTRRANRLGFLRLSTTQMYRTIKETGVRVTTSALERVAIVFSLIAWCAILLN